MTNPTPHGQVPEALRLADEWRRKTQREADRRNSAYDHYGMNNAPETVDPLGSKIAAELRRQHTRIAELEAQIEALSVVQALSAAPAVDDPTRWLTVVYRDISPGDEARLLAEHTKASAMSWSHAIQDRDAARAVLAKWGTPQPVVREPLTDAQIAEMMRDTWGCASIAPRHALEFARAVERAHGITQKVGD